MHEATGTSHAKAILIGEHAVVYSQPAIALPIKTIRMQVTIMPRTQDEQLVKSAFFNGDIRQATTTRFNGIATLIRQLLVRFDARQQGFNLNIISDLPPERGMGSSAATAIAVVRCLYAAFDEALDHDTLLRWANVSERIIHGNPSGIDAATCSADRPQWLIRGQQPRNIAQPKRGVIVIADSGVQGQTGAAVAAVAQLLAEHPDQEQHIEALGQLTRKTALALAEDDIVAIGENMNAAQAHLQSIGVSSVRLDELVAAATSAGALGAKLTGSGMGGCILALAPDKAAASQIDKALLQAGATQTWQYAFAG
ncbi:mevalonate kinase [Lacticaseibacillus pabuli]|uniref:Mevalonate kinase n=1 Tax=Lacticaseibacillus pabuli TaxID=3025672 RepID=A0ABY7WMU6_9LACO|nr:mevalonate kinase [Lacticaseibacillus sp. KACC 23028]WDF81510.1 mevalonate kinase [Lacticaseibacillus sp. KACC 23028]